MNKHVDIVVVGAGLSGIGLSYYLKTLCPNKSLMILEGRDSLGGTWDLFKYPGVRSDSDMYTYGYQFNPWTERESLATGDRICQYLKDTAKKFDIEKHIHYQHKVTHLNWNTTKKRWEVSVNGPQGSEIIHAQYLFACSGYYDYSQGHSPSFKGSEQFKGELIHPQFWPDDVEYENKNVVVIGSGATAVTLVPNLAKKAKHVVMLQRSPTYILSRPQRDFITKVAQAILPAKAASKLVRKKNIWLGKFYFNYMTKHPEKAKKIINKKRRQLLKKDIDGKHFSPRYNPWEQRLCLVPDADLFNSLNENKASIVTDEICHFTETGIQTKQHHLDADIVITATGLKMLFMSGVDICVDGCVQDIGNKMFYQGALLQDIPNFGMVFGYTNASWTLKVELVSQYICRLINHIDANNAQYFVPTAAPDIKPELFLNLSSGYIKRSEDSIPKQGHKAPWRLDQDYDTDKARLTTATFPESGLEIRC